MPEQECRFNWKTFEDRIVRRIVTASQPVEVIATKQFKGIIRTLVKTTPPMHEKTTREDGVEISLGITNFREGLAAGKAKIESDIRSLYGEPDDAFARVEQEAGKSKARNFYALYKHGKTAQASDLLRPFTRGAGLYAFDGGEVHRRYRNKRGVVRYRSKAPVFYVASPRDLADYIREKQSHIFFLASGWKEICAKLGIALPKLIADHNGPGTGVVEITDDRLYFRATNDVSYASAVELERRIQAAIDAQADRMEREWDEFIKTEFWKDFGRELTLQA